MPLKRDRIIACIETDADAVSIRTARFEPGALKWTAVLRFGTSFNECRVQDAIDAIVYVPMLFHFIATADGSASESRMFVKDRCSPRAGIEQGEEMQSVEKRRRKCEVGDDRHGKGG